MILIEPQECKLKPEVENVPALYHKNDCGVLHNIPLIMDIGCRSVPRRLRQRADVTLAVAPVEEHKFDPFLRQEEKHRPHSQYVSFASLLT